MSDKGNNFCCNRNYLSEVLSKICQAETKSRSAVAALTFQFFQTSCKYKLTLIYCIYFRYLSYKNNGEPNMRFLSELLQETTKSWLFQCDSLPKETVGVE